MYKILAIGNSFSEDATYFLHQICEAANIESKIVNLYIGGCPLEKHWRNIEDDRPDYELQINGAKTDRLVSIREILAENEFNTIITQQASGDSGWENTYEPFLGLIVNYLKDQAPKSKLFINQTWAYESNSKHMHFMRYNRNQQEMLNRLCNAYSLASERYNLPLIKSGELVQSLRNTTYFNSEQHCITRDGFHLNYLYGRYAVALLWAKSILNINAIDNTFVPETPLLPNEKPNPDIISLIKQLVDKN